MTKFEQRHVLETMFSAYGAVRGVGEMVISGGLRLMPLERRASQSQRIDQTGPSSGARGFPQAVDVSVHMETPEDIDLTTGQPCAHQPAPMVKLRIHLETPAWVVEIPLVPRVARHVAVELVRAADAADGGPC